MRALPKSTQVQIPPALAEELLQAASRLPVHDNRAYYDPVLQEKTWARLRAGCAGPLEWLVAEARARLSRPPYFALVSGLAFDLENRLFVGLNRAFGELVAPVYKKPRAQLVHYILPADDLAAGDGLARESERLHTDSADWPEPSDLISMRCVRPDAYGGGASRLLDLPSLRTELERELGIGALRHLEQQPAPWRLAPYLGGGVAWRPVITADSIRWRRYTIDAALECDGVKLPEETIALLDNVQGVFADTEAVIEFRLQAGDFLISDNKRTLHGRNAIGGDPRTCGRLMLRSWIRRTASG